MTLRIAYLELSEHDPWGQAARECIEQGRIFWWL